MIYRLDLPTAQATFTNAADGYSPTISKWAVPVNRIRYSNTVYTSRNNGLSSWWYTNTGVAQDGSDYAYDTAMVGNAPIMKYWWGNGLPPMYTPANLPGNQWAVTFKGYMRFDYSANYTFHFGGEGALGGFWIDGANYLSANGSITEKDLSINATALATSKVYTNATRGIWKSVEIRFLKYVASEKSNSGFVCLWETNNAEATPDKVVLSAGITCPWGIGVPTTGADSIADTAIPEYSNVSLNVSDQQGSTFTFEVPFLSSSAPIVSSAGFYYDPVTDSYLHIDQDRHSGLQFKKFRQITYWEGFENPSGDDEFVQKFTGQIRDLNVNLSPDGQDTLEVVCHDYSIFAREQFNVDAPNPIDYLASGYLEETTGHVNGRVKPPTFDGWELHKAFAIMAMNSYLDPYHMTLRNRKSNNDGDLKYANYFVEPYGLNYQIYLDRDPIKYGNPSGVSPSSEIRGATMPPDAEYLHQIGFGEYYQDAITNMTSLYGMEWGVNRFGYPYLKMVGAPRSYMNDRDDSDITYDGSWYQLGKDISAFKATFSSAKALWDSAYASFTGSKCVVLVGYGPDGGTNVAGDTSTPTIYTEVRDSGGNKVETHRFNLYLPDRWHSYDGVYNALGVNPCILNVGNNLTYDDYTIHIAVNSTSNKVLRLEGILIYDDDLDGVKFNFRTSDQYAPGQVTNLNTIDTGQDLRNEAYVLGRFVSYQYDISGIQSDRGSSEAERAIVNPNNPLGEYVLSVTRDLNSIMKSTASNYIGMPRRVLVQDPSIGSQSQADYLSYNIVLQYANPGKNVEFGSIGNPLIEINDKVSIEDEYSQSVDSSQAFWLKNVSSQFDETYTSNYDATSFRPIGAFFPKPQPNISDDFDGIPILNLRVENRGAICRLNQALSKTTTNQIQLTTVTGMPHRGYLYLQKYNDGQKVYEVIKYERRDPDGTDPGYVYNLARGLQYSSNAAWLADEDVIAAYDPYLQEGAGIVPAIKFDSLVTGKVYIRILGDLGRGQTHVNTLTGIGSEDWPYESFDSIEWGGNQVYTWDCRDAVGFWNYYHISSDGQTDMKGDIGYYVAEPKDIEATINNARGRKTEPRPQYSQFYLDFQFIDNEGNVWQYTSKETGRIVSTASVYTRRGPVGKVNMHIQYDGCWYPKNASGAANPYGLMSRSTSIPGNSYGKLFPAFSTAWASAQYFYIDDTSWSFHHFGVDETVRYPRVLSARGLPNWSTWPEYSTLGAHTFWSNPNETKLLPMVHFTPTANGGKGLKVIIRSGGHLYNEKTDQFPNGDYRVQEELDDDYRRHYSIGLKYRRNVLASLNYGKKKDDGIGDHAILWTRALGYLRWPLVNWETGERHYADPFVPVCEFMDWLHEKTDGDFIVDENITWDFYNDGKGRLFYFNPKNLVGDERYEFPPVGAAIKGAWDQKYDISYAPSPVGDLNNDGNIDVGRDSRVLYFYNYVTFHGEFLDNSGRVPIVLGDMFKDPENIYDEAFDSMVKINGDEDSRYRYDENHKPRMVGYVDLSIKREMDNNYINNMPNLVQLPFYIGGPHEYQRAEIVGKYWPRLCPGPWYMWFYKRDGNL